MPSQSRGGRRGAEDERTVIRYNGLPAVGLGIVKQASASTLEVANQVKAVLPQLANLVPKGMKSRSPTTLRRSSATPSRIADDAPARPRARRPVIFVFLKSPSATLIPTLAIPGSIIGAFTVVYFAGFTINILTLLALVLAIGLVVDDAIVMLENIYRHMEMGKSRLQAAFDGAKEIGFAILATTIALVAIFVPVAFLSGNVGRLFNEFGMTVAVAVLISGFVALSLTPMLASRMLRDTNRRTCRPFLHAVRPLDASNTGRRIALGADRRAGPEGGTIVAMSSSSARFPRLVRPRPVRACASHRPEARPRLH